MYTDDEKIDSFLDDLPVAPIPRDFSRRVMANLEPRKHPFRLEFIDLAVPAFLAFFGSLGFIAAVAPLLPPVRLWLVRLQLELQPLLWKLPDGTIPAVIFIGAAILLVVAALAGSLGLIGRTRITS